MHVHAHGIVLLLLSLPCVRPFVPSVFRPLAKRPVFHPVYAEPGHQDAEIVVPTPAPTPAPAIPVPTLAPNPDADMSEVPLDNEELQAGDSQMLQEQVEHSAELEDEQKVKKEAEAWDPMQMQQEPASRQKGDPDMSSKVDRAVEELRKSVPLQLTEAIDYSIFSEDIELIDELGNVLAGGKSRYSQFFETLVFAQRLSLVKSSVDLEALEYHPKTHEIIVNATITTKAPFDLGDPLKFNTASTYKLNEEGLIYEHRFDDEAQRSVKKLLESVGLGKFLEQQEQRAKTARFFGKESKPKNPVEALKKKLSGEEEEVARREVKPGDLMYSPQDNKLGLEWGSLDDVVMGGSSKSDFVTADGTWSGEVITEGGGFAGVRTRLSNPHWTCPAAQD